MYFGFKRLVEAPDQLLGRRGLNRSHHRIMYFIARQPDQTVGELLGTLDVTKQSLNRPLRELTSLGLVASSRDKKDGRVRRLQLTRAGMRLEKQLTGMQHRHLREIFYDAGKNGERGWRRVMERMAEGRIRRETRVFFARRGSSPA